MSSSEGRVRMGDVGTFSFPFAAWVTIGVGRVHTSISTPLLLLRGALALSPLISHPFALLFPIPTAHSLTHILPTILLHLAYSPFPLLSSFVHSPAA